MSVTGARCPNCVFGQRSDTALKIRQLLPRVAEIEIDLVAALLTVS